ncbi:MAG: DUF4097 domain-containing protein [Oscillospiraceae bacterium]|nr:DUF4097 domain-containing protein [Oscillospiraceae bacterium]MCL2279047.1 DUF4097 domain-containing protein [Oscillospiraceae bacterium]
MNKYRIATMVCWIITALVLAGLVTWFITRAAFGIGGGGMQMGRFFNFNFGGFGNFEVLSGPFEEVGRQTISPGAINGIEINWVSGEVTVRPHDGADIIVTEFAQRELRENEQFRVRTSDSTLSIAYIDGRLRNVRVHKRLEVLVPHQLSENMRELSIVSVSGAIIAEGITAERLEIDSTSGRIDVNGAFQRADVGSVSGAINVVNTAERSRTDISSTSGSINADGMFDDLDISAISGSITLTSRIMPSSIDASSISGGITINLPDTGEPISVNHSSVSGRLTSDIPHTTVRGNAQIDISTVSGSTRIQAIGG